MAQSNKELKLLQKKWYKVLKQDGFTDIEKDEDTLHTWTSTFFKMRHNPILSTAKEEYFRLAGQFLHDYPFETKVDRLIWELHSQGLGVRQISKKLKEDRIRLSKSLVSTIVQRIAREMINKCR